MNISSRPLTCIKSRFICRSTNYMSWNMGSNLKEKCWLIVNKPISQLSSFIKNWIFVTNLCPFLFLKKINFKGVASICNETFKWDILHAFLSVVYWIFALTLSSARINLEEKVNTANLAKKSFFVDHVPFPHASQNFINYY